MELNRFLTIVAIVAVFLSAGNFFVNYAMLSSTGNVINDTANLTVEIREALDIRFVVNNLDWGSGYVNPDYVSGAGISYAELNSTTAPYYSPAWIPTLNDAPQDAGPDGFVMDGGLILENFGNVAADIYLRSDYNASRFICWNGTQMDDSCIIDNPSFRWLISQNETGSCTLGTGTPDWAGWTDVNITSGANGGTLICDRFLALGITNSMKIDFQINLSENTPPTVKSVNITASALKSAN